VRLLLIVIMLDCNRITLMNASRIWQISCWQNTKCR